MRNSAEPNRSIWQVKQATYTAEDGLEIEFRTVSKVSRISSGSFAMRQEDGL